MKKSLTPREAAAAVTRCLYAVGCLMFWTQGAPAWCQVSPDSRFVSQIVIQSSGSCVDVYSFSAQVGFGLDQWTCTNTNNQSFAFVPTGDGFFNIQPQNDSLCLDMGSGSVTTGVQVVQNTCSGSPYQKWRLSRAADGSYTITTPDGTGCLDIYAGRKDNGTIVTTYSCHGSSNENFVLSQSSPPGTPTAAPQIFPASGSYSLPLAVTITAVPQGTPAYYTVDGSTPTTNSSLYSGPILLTTSATVKTIALATGAVPSPVVTGLFTLTTPPNVQGVFTSTMVVQSSGSCLNVDNGSSQVGMGLDQWICTGGNNQSFLFSPVTGGFYTIQPQNDNLCLDAGSGATAGAQVVQNTCSFGNSQKWHILANADGSFAVTTFDGAGCLDIYGGRTANGTILTTYACHDASNERFLIAGLPPGSLTHPVTPAPASPSEPPFIFNHSLSARAGDVIYLQGANFDTTSQVRLGNALLNTATLINVINRVGSTWIAAQIPQSWSGAMFVSVTNASHTSSAVKLNAAIPLHLDTLQLVPGGAFRLLGRNLMMPGSTPSITIDGYPATINSNASTEHMLVATAPLLLTATHASVILVDNGNGTGAVRLERAITVVAGSGDPFNLGVGWGAGFTFAARLLTVNTACNGISDDSVAIQTAINKAANGGGGVVQLPSGKCILANSLTMHSNVVLQGAGKDQTILAYRSNYPINSQGGDLVGIRNFTLTNVNGTMEGLIWKQNTRSFFQNVKIAAMVSRQLYLTGNRNFVVAQSDFVQTGSIDGQNPYLFSDCAGFLFSNNTSVSVDGSPTFSSVHDALFFNNHFSRSSINQNEAPVVATHQFVIDFAYRVSIIGNTFDVINGPLTNTNRNDGETILTEGGGGNRTENLGSVFTATSNTIGDPENTINVNPFGTGLPENYGVAIVSGRGAGQTREVVGYANGSLQVDHAWEVVPDKNSRYATWVWGLEKSLIVGNTLTGNPRGIWLYQTSIRDVDVSGNTIVNGGGIFLRTYQALGVKQLNAMYNVRVANNSIANAGHLWMSYTNVVFVNKDTSNFGTADTGIEIRGNSLTANVPNASSAVEDYAGSEGFMNVMRSEASGGQLGSTPMLLGTILQANACLNCAMAFVIGTGDYGTVLFANTPSPGSPNFLSDWQTLGAGIGGSNGTVIR